MRKLKTTDIPAFCRCIKAIGIKDDVQKIAKEANSASDIWGMGFDLIWSIFDKATEVSGEKNIYEFLAGPFEMTAEQVADMDLDKLIEACKKLGEENNLTGFFKFAAASMK